MTDALFSAYVPRTRSRIQGPRRILQELRRLRTKTARALEHRTFTADETFWLARVFDALDTRVSEGEQVLGSDPVDRRVRKRPTKVEMCR
jgi:hypothetical protein